jgi:hypothetical protein
MRSHSEPEIIGFAWATNEIVVCCNQLEIDFFDILDVRPQEVAGHNWRHPMHRVNEQLLFLDPGIELGLS